MIQADTSKPLITVVGASSKQGRSVAEALLDSGRYRVRALTRRRDSQPAQILAQKGAEVVVAPLEAGKQAELTAAMRGSAGAFLMTPPIVKVPPAELEFTLGKELADAAIAAGVEHVVFSGLENVEARTAGTKWAPHFTDKAKVADYIRSLPIRSSFVYLAFFYTNFLEYYVPQRGKDDITFAIYLPPHVSMPFCDPLTAAGPARRQRARNHDGDRDQCRRDHRASPWDERHHESDRTKSRSAQPQHPANPDDQAGVSRAGHRPRSVRRHQGVWTVTVNHSKFDLKVERRGTDGLPHRPDNDNPAPAVSLAPFGLPGFLGAPSR
jgi:NmrA-like family protein